MVCPRAGEPRELSVDAVATRLGIEDVWDRDPRRRGAATRGFPIGRFLHYDGESASGAPLPRGRHSVRLKLHT